MREKGIHIICRIVPPICNGIFTAVFQMSVLPLFDKGDFVHRLFMPAGEWYQRLVPLMILFLFTWVIIDTLSKYLFLLVEKKDLKNRTLKGVPVAIRTESVDGILNQLSGLKHNIRERRVYKRIYSLLEHLKSTGNIQQSSEIFRHQSDIEADGVASGYVVSRVFIWAMPVIGFIGTIMGIGLAVGNFSGFLTGDIDDIGLVKRELSMVAGGLSFAFDTTLLGLTASLFGMLFVSFVQKAEEGVLSSIEDLGLGILSYYKIQPPPSDAATLNGFLSDSIEEFKKTINAQTEFLSECIKDFTRHLQASSQKMSDGFSELLQRVQENERFIINKLHDHEEISHQLKVTFQEGIDRFKKSFDLLTEKVDSLEQPAKELNSIGPLLKGMHETQNRIITVLNNLCGPMEFKLVPYKNNHDHQALEFVNT